MQVFKRIFIFAVAFLLIFQGIVTNVLAASGPDQEPIESQSIPQSSQEDELHILTDVEQSTRLVTNHETIEIGKGVTLSTFENLNARGWINGELLEVDLSEEGVSTGLLQSGNVVAESRPIREATNEEGAIASVNGDFFDINGTKAPSGPEIKNGEILKGPNSGRSTSAGVTTDGLGKIVDVLLEGTVSFHDEEHTLAALNQRTIPENGIGLYNALWGQASIYNVANQSNEIIEIVVTDGIVEEINEEITDAPLHEDTYVLIGREEGADNLKSLEVGDAVSVAYAPNVNAAGDLEFAIGGNPVLVKDGVVQNVNDTALAPRTAVGFSEDEQTMYVALVDGRQASSIGMTLYEMGELMKEVGAYQAINLDGGGSSTMTARLPGDDGVSVQNNPSDGVERGVPNGIGIFTAEGNGELSQLIVSPSIQDDNSYRVFPELTRKFTAKGVDDAYDPVATNEVNWEVYPENVGVMDENGVFHATNSGLALAKATSGNVEGENRIQILGELNRIESSRSRISLNNMEETSSFTVKGFDKNGYGALIEPSDMTLEYDPSVIDMVENENGSFTVLPQQDGVSTMIHITVLDKTIQIPYTIGFTESVLSDFEDISEWRFAKFPAAVQGSIELAEGRTGNGVQLNYDYSTTTATRAAYLQASPSIPLPDQAQKIGLWVHGDGNGAWLRAVIRDADNTQYNLTLASEVNWTGWRYLEASIPEGVDGPINLWRIYPVETTQTDQYVGELIFDDLTVQVPPSIEMPEQQEMSTDPLILQNAEIGDDRWKFAVISDTQFVARNPDSEVMERTRKNLQQIVSEDPDFLVINGDFVDTGYAEDYALAKQVLDEEIGDAFPVYYVPGNHEISGVGNLDNFKEVFGETRHSFVHKDTQFIMLDSSHGNYRVSDYEQLVELKATLQEAKRNPRIRNVAVFSHHPTNDPLPTANSQLGDRKEVALVEEWLHDFRFESGGKGAIFISSHASIFNVNRVDSVPYMVMGSAGKDPYGTADNGGFLGWAMFGVKNESSRLSGIKSPEETDWIRAKVNPLLDAITLHAPESVQAGETVEVDAVGHQPGNINLPLRYPASVNWSGSDNLFIGNTAEVTDAVETDNYDAAFDYTTGEFTAIEQGEITLTVQSNDVVEEATIVIE